jgi:hypothetical protein
VGDSLVLHRGFVSLDQPNLFVVSFHVESFCKYIYAAILETRPI